MSATELLPVRPGTKEHVRKLYGLDTPGKMEQAVEILEQWLKKQNHFTRKEFDKKYLESTLIDTKGSIEKAKDKLEKRCIFRTLLPHFFEINDFQKEFGEFMANQIVGVPAPKLTEEHYRIFSYKVYNNDYFNKFAFLEYYKFSFLINEYVKLNDCCAGYIHVIDLRDVSILDALPRLKPMDFKHWATFLTVNMEFRKVTPTTINVEVQGMRLKKLIYITPSKAIEALLKIVKPLFNKKMADRIEVCKNNEELHKFVPKDVLPVEFGGTEKSVRDIQNEWMKVLGSKEYMDYYKDMGNARVDEKIKKIDKNDNFVEMAGSFVSLSFD